MKMADIFNNGTSTNRNSKFNRIFNSLKWRQKYQNSELYEIDLDNGECFKVQQILNGEMKGFGTGTLVWPAAHVMSKYLERRFGTLGLSNKTVCDIGTGTGITGFVAATLGASVTLTDQQHLLEFLLINKSLAFSSIHSVPSETVTISEYEWSSTEQMANLKAQDFDYLLVSDCVLPKLYPIDILLQAVSGIMSSHTVALFSYEHRPFPQFDPREEFERQAHSLGLRVRVIPLSEHHEVYCAEDIELWEVTWRKSSSSSERSHSSSDCSSCLEVLSWGTVSEVSVIVAGRPHRLQQDTGGVIGAVVWPSAVISSRYLLKTPLSELRTLLSRAIPSLTNNNSLSSNLPLAVDIGAGCGLTSLALLSAGYEVVATDKVLDLLRRNTEGEREEEGEGDSDRRIRVKELDWYSATADPVLLVERPVDLIVCSDCLYSSDAVLRLLDVLIALASSQTVILLCNEMRTAFDEFTYLAGQSTEYKVTFKEIPLIEPDLEICRGHLTGRVASPPLRLCLMHLAPIEIK